MCQYVNYLAVRSAANWHIDNISALANYSYT